jgi:hypothetical protein
MGMINCKQAMTDYMLSKNSIYELRLPISLIAGILYHQKVTAKRGYKMVTSLLITVGLYLIITYTAPLFINQAKLQEMIMKCEQKPQMNLSNILNPITHESFSLFPAESIGNTNTNISMNISNVPATYVPTMPALTPDSVDDAVSSSLHPYTIHNLEHGEHLKPQPTISQNCLLGTDPCSPLCSGDGTNPCNIVSPVPGPAWQVRTAAAVQNSLANGQFTANTCI